MGLATVDPYAPAVEDDGPGCGPRMLWLILIGLFLAGLLIVASMMGPVDADYQELSPVYQE